MKKGSKEVLIWETLGLFWLIIVGSLLHFVYDWSGQSLIVAVFSPVNESVWEHLKLGYWALVFFSLIEYPAIKDKVKNYFWGKTLGVLALEVFIILFFYTYTAIIGEHILWLDIASYVVGSIICQIINYNIISRKKPRFNDRLGLICFIGFGGLLILFTFFPPHLPIFKDPKTGEYGIADIKWHFRATLYQLSAVCKWFLLRKVCFLDL
ncbi:DUF6512 family protein [Halanaerobaculum tunisiense]